MNQEKVNKRNRGFTLVEVLIATAILGIVIGPILSSFVSVAKVNSTSRKKLTATTIAESVAESVKAYQLSDFAKQCDYPEDGFTLLAGDLEKGTKFSGGACELLPDCSDVIGLKAVSKNGTKYNFTPVANRKYAFMITDIPMGGSTYDAIVTYTVNLNKSDREISTTNGDKKVKDVLGQYSVRTLNYYNVTITVYKSVSGSYAEKAAAYHSGNEKKLAIITGTKADYN